MTDAWRRRGDHVALSKEYHRNRKVVMRRDMGLCLICHLLGRVTAARDCDHVLPRSAGGRDTLDNLAMLCPDCHSLKTRQEKIGTDRLLLPVRGADGWEAATVTREEYQAEIDRRNAKLAAETAF